LSAFAGLLPGLGGRALAADTGTVTVAATILSNSNCRFSPPNATVALAFGLLDPLNPVDVTVTTSLLIRCGGSSANATYLITDDDGLHASAGVQRMQHAVTLAEYLPYAFSYAPASATIPRNTNTNITITGTVTGASYQNSLAGDYADSVTLTINP
jgi:hypothetical protein